MIIKQDFWFNSLGASRKLHIRIPDHGEQLGIFMPLLWQE